MTAVSLKKILNDANKNNYAVAGLVVLSWDDALAFTKAADETGIPIILQAGPSCRAHTPVPILGKMFRYLAEQTKTHICCHIDHGYTVRECLEGIDSGFTSVMFDGSTVMIEKGYHPCVVAPGYEMYYFTILGGLTQRSLIQFFQPEHAYQVETIPGIKDMIAKYK